MKFAFIDDSAISIGGTQLTLNAIIEPNKENVDIIPTDEFCLNHVFKGYDFFIFGNILNLNLNSLDSILYVMDNYPFAKIEFDYGYCPYRGSIPHEILGDSKCSCPFGATGKFELKQIYSAIKNKSKIIFYMSQAQMDIHKEKLNLDDDRQKVLSSCFTKDCMLKFKELKSTPKNEEYAIIDGQGGWHSRAKGIQQSINFAESNNLKYKLIKTDNHEEMINLLSKYKGLISMPIIHDTCPRITLEARYLGLEVLTNEFSQHVTEDWWKSTDEEAFNFTESRPNYFWKEISCLK
jgi:hypothetical protein